MKENIETRHRLEDVILKWANKEYTPIAVFDYAQATLFEISQLPHAQPCDKVCETVAQVLSHHTYPDNRGYERTKDNWARACRCVALLRSNIVPVEWTYNDYVHSRRQLLFRIYSKTVLALIVVGLVFFGWRALLLWPLASVPGWIHTCFDLWSQGHHGPGRYYPFDSMAQWEANAQLANREPKFPDFVASHSSLGHRFLGYCGLALAVLAALPFLLLFVAFLSTLRGPFMLKAWCVTQQRVPANPVIEG